MNELIFIAEDEPKIASLLSDYLVKASYRTHCLADGAKVVPELRQREPALLLLDLMLPNVDGVEICRQVRGFSTLPIIMVTARVDEIDRLLGLGVGADDYICKPFSPREVVARVGAALRRQHWQDQPPGSDATGISVDEDTMRAFAGEVELSLTPVEFRLLQCFCSHPGRVFSRAQLMDLAYSDHRIVSERTIDSHVKNLRQKLSDVKPDSEMIQSIYGAGYRFEPE